MHKERLKQTGEFYMDSLLNDVVPFWLKHGLDREYGGIGNAPKFPHPTTIERLLRHWR